MRKIVFVFSLVLFFGLLIAVLVQSGFITKLPVGQVPSKAPFSTSLVKKIAASQFDSVNWDTPQSTDSTSYIDVEGSELNFTLDKKSSVLIFADINAGLDFPEATESAITQMFVAINVDGQILPQAIGQIGERASGGQEHGGEYDASVGTHKLIELDPGSHALKLGYKKNQIEGTDGIAVINYYVFSYIVLEE